MLRFEKKILHEGTSIEETRYTFHINKNYFVYASVFKHKTVYGDWNDIKQENPPIKYKEYSFASGDPDIGWILSLKNPLPKYVESQAFNYLRELIAHYKEELIA